MDTDDVVLNPSERVLWAGGPRRSGLFSLAAGVVVSGVLTWVAFAYVAAGFRWFVLVCAVSGLGGGIGRWRGNRSARYVVTTERVMVSI